MRSLVKLTLLAAACTIVLAPVLAQDEAGKRSDPLSSVTFSGLGLRLVGPAVTSGRIAAIAVDPNDRSRYFRAAASGGVWKTTNAGTTFMPVFDSEGSY